MSLDALATELHATAKEKHFWDDKVDIHFVLGKLALVHSEVSEVLEAVRKEKGSEEVVTEMADIIVRLLDLYEGMIEHGWVYHSLDAMLDKKAGINKERPALHGNLA